MYQSIQLYAKKKLFFFLHVVVQLKLFLFE